MSTKLEREVRFLKIYAIVATTVFLCAFAHKNQRFEEIDVERINIVEKDGKLRMVISNQERQHPGIVNGKVIQRQGPRPPGMIFFNHLGDEMGGLIFGDNGDIGHFGSLTWDKVRGDQTMGFRHLESDNGTYQSGLEMWQQRDRGEGTTNRVFFGKQRDDSVALLMSDIKGRPRLKLQVLPDGAPALEFLDETGTVTYSLPTKDRTQP